MGKEDRWYKSAIIYCVDVDTFMDADGDGIGDFRGLSQRLDYLWSLGVTCIWLLPFFPSPNRDNGYDVIDYYGVDPRLGTLGDVAELLHEANSRGMRVIIDLVVNHTSDQHPWFQEARRDPTSRYRDYYVWSEKRPSGAEKGVVFPGVQKTTWTRDKRAGAFYHHRFYDHQPDLNISNPAVRDEIKRIMGFWLALGVSGFRVDAAPFLIELHGSSDNDPRDPYDYLNEFREFLSWRQGDAILLAEANVAMDKILEYFGGGQRMQLLFNFFLNQHVFLAFASREARPIVDALGKVPDIPESAQWANFLRNHDEIDLGRLSDKEREECFAEFGPDKSMQLYDRGVRRRLAPMLGGDRRRLEIAFSLMFTLPGTPVLWYGDEIGMGDDLSLAERNSVRTPMQWSPQRNAGFSSAPARKLLRPVVSEGAFAFSNVNVLDQHRDRDSLLSWMERLIGMRKECPELGWGTCHAIQVEAPAVLVHRLRWRDKGLMLLHNLGGSVANVSISDKDLEKYGLIDWFGNRDYGGGVHGGDNLELDAYGYRWFRLTEPARTAAR